MGSGGRLKANIVTPMECLQYALNPPTSVVITGIDSMSILEQAIEAVRTFKPWTRQAVDKLLAKTAKSAAMGEFEMFKTSSHFDSTAQNPKWLGKPSSRVMALTGD